MRSCLVAILVLLALGARATAAEALRLAGDRFWAVLYSNQDEDHAIGFARGQYDLKPRVVHTTNGLYAAIAGPYAAKPGQGHRVLDGLSEEHGAPKDAFLTHGDTFEAVVWTPPESHVEATLDYDGTNPASMRKGQLEITVTRQPDGDDAFAPVAKGRYMGKAAFAMAITGNGTEVPAAKVQLVRLDPASPDLQVVLSYFSQGAHCCTLTRIATLLPDGGWKIIDAGTIDGDGGYAFEDIDNTGFSYLVSSDQSFLYAFDSYASSVAPIEIEQLIGARLVNVTSAPRFQHRLLQDLYGEEQRTDGDDAWHSNGFLAGWVASSLLVGRGEAAWTRMLSSWDHQSDFGPERCTIAKPIDSCPDDKRQRIPFPTALRDFLVEHGYIHDAKRFKLTSD